MLKLFIKAILLLNVLVVAACSTTDVPYDPWENINRKTFVFNEAANEYVVKPVAEGYKFVVPNVVRSSVSNFFNNLTEIKNIANDLLQLNFRQTGNDGLRFLINSTVGIFGLFDIATKFGIEQNKEDFGQTLAVWGIKNSPFLILPFLGPTTVVGATDILFNATFPELSPIYNIEDTATRNSLLALWLIDTVYNVQEAYEILDNATDKYTLLRSFYLQYRQRQINNGNVDSEEDDDEFEFVD